MARDLNIPLQIDMAIELSLGKRHVKVIDAMKVEDDYFLLNIGIGVSSQTMRNVQGNEKRSFGILSYMAKGFLQFIGFNPHKFRLAIDGHT